ncbi:MAG: HAD hydrolase-like protein, partial [Ghiorsea sp.]|nr:HAD hydrolase-like protein [Ghiorsea sp.]
MIKMVAFDVFGVVISEGHMISNALMPLLPKHASKVLVKSFYNPYTRGEISEQSFWQGIGVSEYADIRHTFLNSFVLDEDLPQVVSQLSDKYALSILSNLGSAWADELMLKFDFENTFKPIIFSGKVGFEKPNPDNYKLLIAKSGLK